MRQVVVLEPAGSVLVIRQHSLAGLPPVVNGCSAHHHHHHHHHHDHHHHPAIAAKTQTTTTTTTTTTTRRCNALGPPSANTSPTDHNQNRIVVVRSSTGLQQPVAVKAASATAKSDESNNNNSLGGSDAAKPSVGEKQASFDSGTEEPAGGDQQQSKSTEVTVVPEKKNDPGTTDVPGTDGDPIKLPENLETLPRAEHFPTQRHRWNTNEEIAAILISFQRHAEWQSREVKVRPRSGSMLLYSRKKVRYRRDGYCWKKRKDGKTTREDHMKLKVQGVECIYGCYVHSAILPTFHRRCYWLLQNPDVVLVHYLNVPYPDGDAKLAALPPCLALPPDKKEWTRDELASQLRPMFLGSEEPEQPANGQLHHHHQQQQHQPHPVDMIVSQLLDRQQRASSAGSSTAAQLAPRRLTPDNQVSSTTGGQQPSTTASTTPRVYSRHSHSTSTPGQQQPAPLVLSLQQIQGGGGLLILNSQPYHHQQQQQCAQAQNQQVDMHQDQHHHHHHQQQQQQQQHQQQQRGIVQQQTSIDREQQSQQHDIDSKDGSSHGYICASTYVVGGAQGAGNCAASDFAESLELCSQEDIQRTLSANMVHPSPSPSPADNSMIDPMDFIDSSDDVLVNLDVFDMFSDLPELHDFEPEQPDKPDDPRIAEPGRDGHCRQTSAARITEYSPEWSYTEGGVKVLVAGPWTGNSGSQSYSVLFDNEPVEACLVQPGVLRCRCPAHAAGLASLQVACDGFVVSDSVAFEYRRPPPSEPNPEKALLDRLADVETRLQGPGPPSPAAQLEERLVAYCQDATVRPWRSSAEPLQSGGPTLLHLAAGLGYSRLACALLHWRAENPSRVLDAEVDALRQDSAGLTPLAWACAAGHADTARILYRWNAMALRVRDCRSRSATELAAENGHADIAEELNLLEARRQDEGLFLKPASPSPRRPSQDSGLDLALCGSPLLDNMELLQDDDSSLGLGMESTPSPSESVGEEDARVLTLAEQIIAALPERIKREQCDPRSPSPPPTPLDASLMEQMVRQSFPLDTGELFDSYRECGGGAASVSDADAEASPSSPSNSSSCLTPDSPSPPPTTADFCDFLQLQLELDSGVGSASSVGSSCSTDKVIGSAALAHRNDDDDSSADLSRLTLSDREQRELYHAARMIQKAYRNYKGRQRQEELKRNAAVIIQQFYRRHKQYAYNRQATKAALVIQSNYRNYRARPGPAGSARQQAANQQKAHQAARTIQQFMRQSKINGLSWDDSRPTAERQGRRKREREAGAGCHFQGGCCPPKLALI
ncbi:calmodulin-binding transcription activator 2 [Copidosoma floridanum]|uniref:calmodulin-binding transcription activator 2 n=1 Tax=Copidosoma floridanum TaxID=29053 RepID=UPI000C6F7CD9|nr:calmodulin-binding transcription activator 2 [Copidosoma floridanum]